MELREMKKLGIVGKQKKKRKVKGHHHHGNGGQSTKKENVFDFLNKKLGSKKSEYTHLQMTLLYLPYNKIVQCFKAPKIGFRHPPPQIEIKF